MDGFGPHAADTGQKPWQFQGRITVNDATNQLGHLLVFGPGFTANAFIDKVKSENWTVSATWRREEIRASLLENGIEPVAFDAEAKLPKDTTHVLVSIAPRPEGDPVLSTFKNALKDLPNLRWVGYLSSTNVYGDHGGDWVDETSETKPSLDRGKRRLLAEQAWTDFGEQIGAAVHIFRLAGIYGPGKNAIRSVLDGKARRVIKPDQVFGRVHREDIASALWLASQSTLGSEVFNLSDDLPSPPQDVIAYAAELLGVDAPPEVSIEEADLSPMGRSFYEENKRVSNQKAKGLLSWTPKWPDYQTALPKIMKQEVGD